MLQSRNDDVDDINSEMLKMFPGVEKVLMSADSVKNNSDDNEERMLVSCGIP